MQHEIDQIRRSAKLTPKQRLDWLWQAKVFAHRAMLAAEQRRAQVAAASAEAGDVATDASAALAEAGDVATAASDTSEGQSDVQSDRRPNDHEG
jgi:hypothetical protein